MANNKMLVWGGVGAALLYFISRAGSSLQQSLKYLQYQVGGARFNFSNPLKPEVILRLDLYNPNNTAIPIQDFFGNISAGGTRVANFNGINVQSIPARQRISMEVSAKVSAFNVVMKIINGQSLGVLTVDGVLKTGMFDMPVNKTFDIKNMVSGMEENYNDESEVGFLPLFGAGLLARKLLRRKKKKKCTCRHRRGFLQWGRKCTCKYQHQQHHPVHHLAPRQVALTK